MTRCFGLFFSVLLVACAGRTEAADVYIFTENYPPYNFIGPDGQVEGDATRLVRKVMDQTGLDYDIAVVPWARAVRFTETGKDVLIYSIARTPPRENRFHWLVPLAQDRYYLFARKANNRPVTLEGLKNGEFSIICVQGDISCLLLQQSGIPTESIFKAVELDQPGTLKMVEIGRVDLFPGSVINYLSNTKYAGAWKETFKPVYDLEVGLTLYMASSAGIAPEIEAAIKAAHARLVANDDFDMMYAEKPPLDQ